MAEAADSVTIECGYCLSRDEAMQDPRVLPCSHVSCRVCLAGQLEKHKVVRCPHCKEVFDVVVDSLPTFKPGGDDKYKCGICDKEGTDKAAVMYCNACTKTKFYCDKHQQWHDAIINDDHVGIPITDYKAQAGRLETRACEEHKDRVYTVGCGVCLKVFCDICISPLNKCASGKAHEWINLDELTDRLAGDIKGLSEAMIRKQEKLSALFKITSKCASNYREKTTEIVDKLHATRDKQIEAIQTKYNKLEEELVASRRTTYKEMISFMEDEVGTKLTILGDQRASIETRVRNNHRVDIVTTYRDTQTDMNKLIDARLPTLTLDKVKTLSISDNEKRDIEVKISPADNISICCELVSSLTLQKTIQSSSPVWSFCNYKGATYIGTQNSTIDVIDERCNIQTLVSHGLGVSLPGITIHQDIIYVPVIGTSNTINAYNLSGHLITRWTRRDKCQSIKPAIVSDQLILPDTNKKRLTVYSLQGQVVKHITCPLLQAGNARVCAADERSVIVTNGSLVFRVDITTGERVWECRDVTEPQASAMYANTLVCIASREKMSFLSAMTGDLLSVVVTDYSYLDIDINGSILLASTSGDDKMLLYQMNK